MHSTTASSSSNVLSWSRTCETLTDRGPTAVGPEITIDYAKSILSVDGKSFVFPPLSPAAPELIVAGGAEKLVASQLGGS
jgi:hypothetical protein